MKYTHLALLFFIFSLSVNSYSQPISFTCQNDAYQFEESLINGEKQIVGYLNDKKNLPRVIQIKKGDELVPAVSVITMRAVNEDETISDKTDSIIGDYFLVLGHGKKYEMTVETEGFAPYKRVFEIPEQKEYFLW